ncbi:hypothetical protein [Streptomyces sp. NBC_01602]|uniref:hypothetical protein n=1 Tax=Streptomyces sp. NBC_01602 TaxID=2975893 RepID=UPI0038670626|nr:hypothetical protein OG955_07035 [Streptomyces sp. NBC_01602]
MRNLAGCPAAPSTLRLNSADLLGTLPILFVVVVVAPTTAANAPPLAPWHGDGSRSH